MKPLVIYHDNCMDGFGAAFAAWLALGNDTEFLPMSYGDIDLDSERIAFMMKIIHREVYILDFSFSREITELVMEHASTVTWLDHHRTAFEMWRPGEYDYWTSDPAVEDRHIVLDNSKSGALLAWEHFFPAIEPPMLFKIIDDRDRWQFKFADTKAISAAIFAQRPWSFEQWAREFMPIDMGSYTASFEATARYSSLRKIGELFLAAHDERVKATADHAGMPCKIIYSIQHDPHLDAIEYYEFDGLAANCPVDLTSDVGHELATRSGTYALLWRMDKKGLIKCSLRSNGDFDVSAIAKQFGGGGHKNAAGFEIDVSTLLSWLQK